MKVRFNGPDVLEIVVENKFDEIALENFFDAYKFGGKQIQLVQDVPKQEETKQGETKNEKE